MKRLFAVLFLLTAFGSQAQKTISARQIQEFDSYVETVRKEWGVPGMSIAVVKDNQVILKKGYGVREIGKPEKVDTQTLFACASTTKAMTVILMGMLVDEGKVRWDDPVYKYLPELQFSDPYTTREIRVRDLLIHNTGIGSTDFFTGYMNIPVNEMLRRMIYVKPQYPVRGGFVYQNIMYSAAGRIIERITGKLWSDVIQERIFTPLGMTQTAPKRKFIKTNNVTRPHDSVNGTIQVLEYGNDSEIGSAGAVWSSADDMSKWIICMLDSSKYAGGRLVKPETWNEIFKAQNFFPASEYPTMEILKPSWMTYGLGWYQHDYKGKKLNFHTGSLSGLTAITAQLPEEKFAIYIFGNYDHAEVRHVLMYKAIDHFILGGNRDWNKEFKTLYSKLKDEQRKREQELIAKRVPDTSPSLPLAQYAGRYESPLYGEAEVNLSGKQLVCNVNNVVKATVSHWHYDTFMGPYEKASDNKATARFSLNSSGKVDILFFNGMEFRKK
ncbi:serine hydrolase [Dyadobacter bucti]|uniref:serine hydrolase n=1 Tax=Dyadobacter bucti TaxID=2572203 RepID=UPI001109900D|nr:serine hydrolase [Dyadobacter bucti]